MHEHPIVSRRAAATLTLAAFVGPAAAAVSQAAASPDPVLEQIEQHRALRAALARMSGRDDDPTYLTACDVEEAALQALGDAMPTTTAGAAALLHYMAEVEGDFADPLSPLLRTVLTVARGLGGLAASSAS